MPGNNAIPQPQTLSWDALIDTTESLGSHLSEGLVSNPSTPTPLIYFGVNGLPLINHSAHDGLFQAGDLWVLDGITYRALVSLTNGELFWQTFASTPTQLNTTPESFVQQKLGSTQPAQIMDITKTTLQDVFKYKEQPPVDLEVSKAVRSLSEFCRGLGMVGVPPKLPSIIRGHKTLVGIEIEVENFRWAQSSAVKTKMGVVEKEQLTVLLQSCWGLHGDGSLRNEGMEFITRLGTKAQDVPQMMYLLNLYLQTGYAKVDSNHRTGLHVHLNVRNFTVEQFINLVMLYILFEDTYYTAASLREDRRRNIFCVPLRASESEVEAIFSMVHMKAPTYNEFRNIFRAFKKYMAFNLRPTGVPDKGTGSALGTVEFRHHEGMHDIVQTTRWVNLLLAIHTAAQEFSFQELKTKIFALNTVSNYSEFADDIFQGINLQEITTRRALVDDMYRGSAFLKELFVTSKGAK